VSWAGGKTARGLGRRDKGGPRRSHGTVRAGHPRDPDALHNGAFGSAYGRRFCPANDTTPLTAKAG
jgi:hypothetical protein